MSSRFIPLAGAALGVIASAGLALAADIRLLNVSYDPTRELYAAIGQSFAAKWKAQTGDNVKVELSNGGSGKQARSVIDGLNADVVTLALGWDITAIEKAGLINSGWQNKFPNHASPYTSTIAFLVRKGNPKGIKDWSDLLRSDVQVITANPKTSGGARWSFLSLWGAFAKAKTHDFSTAAGQAEAKTAADSAKDFPIYNDEEARKKVAEIFNKHVPVLDAGARGSTVTFAQKQIGDVLLNWENELWLAKDEFGADKFDIVYPSTSILTEPPVAVVDKVVDQRGTRKAAEAYLNYLYTPEAQDVIGQLHYRPRDVAALNKYSAELPKIPFFTIDETYGGWAKAQTTFFADGGVFDQFYKPTN
ncbi:sulfate transport system substrate-binding protein [Rhodoblastus acidophilus]|uniref:sulfate ABC transporter substrate-binding protein n=1 Tax=Rhodoblastus acidophilus TaxID=1074 RepID=UPI00222595A5|nr:sulfate ABC transporter substrate-binding protein [Rhodoblastus acidophilus]MCW2318194.1 sulfate transport system substrate-binding protein [Rhodoblastus acidophilus]